MISGFWSPVDGTAVGCITNYLCNPVYTLTCAQRSKLLIRLLCPEKEAINVTVFRTVEQRGMAPHRLGRDECVLLAGSCALV